MSLELTTRRSTTYLTSSEVAVIAALQKKVSPSHSRKERGSPVATIHGILPHLHTSLATADATSKPFRWKGMLAASKNRVARSYGAHSRTGTLEQDR